MISLTITGLQDTISAVRDLPTTVGLQSAFSDAAQRVSAIVRERTPPGYSGRLPESVLVEEGELGFLVGYESGVETAGDSKYDSVRVPKTSGRSVLARKKTWASVEDLQSVLEDAIDGNSGEIMSIFERSIASGLS